MGFEQRLCDELYFLAHFYKPTDAVAIFRELYMIPDICVTFDPLCPVRCYFKNRIFKASLKILFKKNVFKLCKTLHLGV